jgi:hypothetical protein
MPPLTRAFIKAALVYFVAALLVGVAIAVPGLAALPAVGALVPVYFHLFMVGWVTQLIFGVSLWMFPRHSKERPRGDERLAVLALVALNAGLCLRAAAEPARAVSPRAFWGWLLALSAALQWLGGVAYVANIWTRVKER